MSIRLLSLAALCLLCAAGEAETMAQPMPVPDKAALATTTAARNFLDSLDEPLRAKVLFDFNDEAQRKRWSNLPATSFKRGGLRLGDLAPKQRDSAMAVLAAALSPGGYQKVLQIIEGDEVLKQTGGSAIFGRDEYFISFLGRPSTTEPWMIQFGGHHLGLNITLVNERSTIAPSHTGAQPARYEFRGKMVRPLGGETDKAFALLVSLDEAQRKQAILGFQMRDLVLGPRRDGQTIAPEGIKGSELSEIQRRLLLDLAGEWTGILHEAAAQAKMEDLRQHIAETWFAWSGPTEKGSAAYFRIQGPTVIIEYAPQRLGGDPTQHIHTIYREPGNDYAEQWLRRAEKQDPPPQGNSGK